MQHESGQIPQEVIDLAEQIHFMFERVTITHEEWADRLKASRQTLWRIRSFVKSILDDKQLVPLPNKLALIAVATDSRRNYPEPVSPSFSRWLANLEEAYTTAWEVHPSSYGEITKKRRAVQLAQEQPQEPITEPHRIPPNSLFIYETCGD